METRDEDLWKAFESCGEIEDVRIIRVDATGIGKGFGYVNFKTEEAAEKAIELDGLSILERNVRVMRNEIGTQEHTEKLVKRKRGKKKKKAVLPDNTDEESNENDFQESNCEITKVEIEPKQKKVKKDKSKQFMKKPKTSKKSVKK